MRRFKNLDMYPKPPYPKISVVICTLNEAKNLPYVLPYIPDWVDEVILVDGHSTDGTVEVAKKLRPDVKVFYQPRKGKGEALKYGVKKARGDIIVTLDGDGTCDSAEMYKFVEAILMGNDFAKGTRFMNGGPLNMPAHRRLGNKILALVANLLYHSRYTDICSGYYAFKREIFQKINLISDGFEMEQELFVKIAKMKLNVAEVPHLYKKRMYGTSKTKDLTQGIKDLLWIISFRFRS
jgi:glycosyltransferase involved in cell wall biosynthesis